MKKFSLGLGLALILALALTITAFAEAVTVTGTVTAIDEVGGTFTVTLADATVYTVTPPVGFDWTSIFVGQSVDVSGESDGAGNLAASSVSATVSTVTGVVQSIDYATCTFTILTSEGTTLTVTAPEGTDCSGILLGSTIELTGTLNADGTFSVTGVVIVPTEVGEGTNQGFYCTNPTVPHPALSMVATSAGFDYVTTLNWFCGATGGEDGGKTVLGIGEIKKLLDLSAASGQSPDAIIAMRQTMGWGQIKKLLAQGAETTVTEETTTGETTGPGNSGDHGGGKPPWAGNGGNGGNGHGHGKP
jgi:hypothetical protein